MTKGKHRDTGSRSLRCISKEWLQWAQTLASPHTEKSSKFLGLGYLVLFNVQKKLLKNFWHSSYLSFVAELLHNLVPPFASSEQFYQGCLRSASKAWSSKNFHIIKHNSELLGWECFLNWHLRSWRDTFRWNCQPEWCMAAAAYTLCALADSSFLISTGVKKPFPGYRDVCCA